MVCFTSQKQSVFLWKSDKIMYAVPHTEKVANHGIEHVLVSFPLFVEPTFFHQKEEKTASLYTTFFR